MNLHDKFTTANQALINELKIAFITQVKLILENPFNILKINEAIAKGETYVKFDMTETFSTLRGYPSFSKQLCSEWLTDYARHTDKYSKSEMYISSYIDHGWFYDSEHYYLFLQF